MIFRFNRCLFDRLESFLQSHTSLLHPNHYLFTNTRRLLSRLYSKIPRRLLETRSPALLERQIDICQKLLSIADVLDPGLSCSRGSLRILKLLT